MLKSAILRRHTLAAHLHLIGLATAPPSWISWIHRFHHNVELCWVIWWFPQPWGYPFIAGGFLLRKIPSFEMDDGMGYPHDSGNLHLNCKMFVALIQLWVGHVWTVAEFATVTPATPATLATPPSSITDQPSVPIKSMISCEAAWAAWNSKSERIQKMHLENSGHLNLNISQCICLKKTWTQDSNELNHWSRLFFLNNIFLENRLNSSGERRHGRSESIALFSTKDEPAVVSNFFHTSTDPYAVHMSCEWRAVASPWHPHGIPMACHGKMLKDAVAAPCWTPRFELPNL